MILIIQTNKEELHFEEFVKPIGDILIKNNLKGFIIHYSCLKKKDLEKAEKIIICGTSLKDNKFLQDINKFNWIKDYKKPILGICAGHQIISLIFGGSIKNKTNIGFFEEKFKSNFLNLENKEKIYLLQNNYTTLPNSFNKYNLNKIPFAIKHKKKKIYGVLFHPEVRQKKIIIEFVENG